MHAIALALATAGQPLCGLPPDKLAKAVALSRWRTGLYFGDTAWMIAALAFLVRRRAGKGIASLAAKASQRAWIQGLIAAPAWLVILSLLELPGSILGHHVGLAFGLSVEAWPAWCVDWLKSLGLTILVGTLVLGVLYALLRHAPRRWWLWFWAFTVPAVVIGTFVTPLVIDPLFNHFKPLAKTDPGLVDRLEQVIARGGMDIPRDRIFVMDASRRVTGPNAYVTGIGASKRIVVWDTTLKEESPNAILFTYGHEQGHYVLHHIPKGIAFSAALIFVFYWIGARILASLLPRWGIERAGDWSSLGIILLLLTVLSFLSEPVGNAFSRHVEHQADVYGQEVIRGLVPDPQATVVHSFCSDATLWLDAPEPNRFVEFWTYSHPSTEERAEFAAHYDPWGEGRKPRFFGK